ncbi:MAG: hypothetical protein V4631_19335 [Pseudomonadota bacterium]
MNSRIILALTAVACVAAWLLTRDQESDRATPPGPIAPTAQLATIGQAGWFSSMSQAAGPPATAGSGAQVHGRNGRAIDLGGLNIAQYIASRVGAARSGDPKAAYEVYQAESVCATNADPVADYQFPAEREKFLRERAGLVKLCEGLSPAQVQERLGFLGTAARAGHIGAQVDFYMEGPFGREFDMAENAADPAVKQWKADAIGYLKQAGDKCDHFALALLATVYDAGQLTERDMRSSMAYSIAAAVPRKKPMSEEQLRSRFGDEMSAEDFHRARQLGEQLALQACPR